MPEWAIVLFAAFGGGLAGAVLQPVVIYALQRVRSGEEIRKRRERSLRRMLNSRMNTGRSASALSYKAVLHKSGVLLEPPDVLSELDKIGERFVADSAVAWQPERIEDPRLGEMAREYSDKTTLLLLRIAEPESREDRTVQLRQDLQALEREIARRMDELNWPEVED
jgi:hypothetical protein